MAWCQLQRPAAPCTSLVAVHVARLVPTRRRRSGDRRLRPEVGAPRAQRALAAPLDVFSERQPLQPSFRRPGRLRIAGHGPSLTGRHRILVLLVGVEPRAPQEARPQQQHRREQRQGRPLSPRGPTQRRHAWWRASTACLRARAAWRQAGAVSGGEERRQCSQAESAQAARPAALSRPRSACAGARPRPRWPHPAGGVAGAAACAGWGAGGLGDARAGPRVLGAPGRRARRRQAHGAQAAALPAGCCAALEAVGALGGTAMAHQRFQGAGAHETAAAPAGGSGLAQRSIEAAQWAAAAAGTAESSPLPLTCCRERMQEGCPWRLCRRRRRPAEFPRCSAAPPACA